MSDKVIKYSGKTVLDFYFASTEMKALPTDGTFEWSDAVIGVNDT